MATPLFGPKFQAMNSAGVVPGAKLYTYAAGTTTPQPVYTAAALDAPHANPVICDANGQKTIFPDPALSYRYILKDASDVTIWDVDNITGGDADFISFRQAGTGATASTVQDKLRESLSVKDFGAVGDGVTDDTAAIMLADAAACAGNITEANTVVSEYAVHFPAGTYKVTGLTYRGAPWFGDGPNNTVLMMYASSGACIDAQGTISARKTLNIRDMKLDGTNSTGTAHALRLGFNQRSLRALDNVRMHGFPGAGIYFKGNSWVMAFYNVYISFCGSGAYTGQGIYIDTGSVTDLLAFDWHNLVLENNGFIASGTAGGIVTQAPCQGWNFYGGVIEGNYGTAEATFTDTSNVNLYGTYFEADAASVLNGVVFDGSTIGGFHGGYVGRGSGVGAASGLVIADTAQVVINQPRSNDRWTTDLEVTDTAVASVLGEGLELLTFSVASGARLRRALPKRMALTDAATIALDAATGTSFYVTLGGNRTLGAPTNPSAGQRLCLTVYQDATGGRTLAFNAVFKVSWSNTGNTASKLSTIEFEYDGTSWNQVSAQSPYI
jgi:hypothetical protein